ncbi:glyoxalase [Paenibacillus koleovorans]|uniref:glyoxalase n=1 Tax=Paenibacillus koleovorans TaxID=121608 RepID=UPI000FDB8F5C|nr:glyoxalase [Paenibacillus koleovorans]
MTHSIFTYTGIDHVQIAAPPGCEPEARAFYGGILMWEELPKPEPLRGRGGIWFQCGAHQVHIGVQKDFVPATKAHPAFLLSGLDRLREYLTAHRVPIVEDDARAEEGVNRFFLHDPFGNRLEFMEKG